MENSAKVSRRLVLDALPNENLFSVYYLQKRSQFKFINFQFFTKTEWECLKCGAKIFIGFNQQGRKSIFCDSHEEQNKRPTIVQMQYIKRLKDEQVALLKKIDSNYAKLMENSKISGESIVVI